MTLVAVFPAPGTKTFPPPNPERRCNNVLYLKAADEAGDAMAQ